MKLQQETDWRNTKVIRGRNYLDWSEHFDAAITDADQRSQLRRRGDELLAEGRRDNSDREPGERQKREGRSVAMDSAGFVIPYTIFWPSGKVEHTFLRPLRLAPEGRKTNV